MNKLQRLSIGLFFLGSLLLSGCGSSGGYGYRGSSGSIYYGYGYPYYYYDHDHDDHCCYRPPHRPEQPNRPDRPNRPRPPSDGPSIQPVPKPGGPSIQPVNRSRPSFSRQVRPRPSVNMGRPNRMRMSHPTRSFRRAR